MLSTSSSARMPTARVLESHQQNNNSNQSHRRNNHRIRPHNRQPNTSNQNNASSSSISSLNNNASLTNDATQFESISSASSAGSAAPPQPKIIRTNTEYERIRNQTLMFFLDRLIVISGEEKGRSLHDLSCLFGSKEFTREMRQIVGASRNGLRKFLESFPSLFTIEGDRVYLTSLTKLPPNNNNNDPSSATNSLDLQSSNNHNNDHSNSLDDDEADRGAGGRDYKREAVDYFSAKLTQFGQSHVPIRYLFGYRSQATQEVRHVSGRNSHEFRQFLLDHSDKFELVGDESVILRAAAVACPQQQQLNSLMSLECRLAESNVSMDPYLNKQLASSIGARMRQEQVKELTLGELHSRMNQQSFYMNQIKSLGDLRMLLRMHPRLFKHDWHYHHHGDQQQSQDNKELARSKVTLLEPHTSATAMRRFSLDARPAHTSNSSQIAEEFSGPTSLLVASPNVKQSGQTASKKANNLRSIRSALRADAPPFVPAHLQRSQSSLAGGKHSIIANEAHQSLRSYLIRASASNEANFNPLKPANQRLPDDELESASERAARPKSIVSEQEQLRARWISVVREASSIVSRIMSSTDAIALDCKGFNLGSNGEISLIQIAFMSNEETTIATSGESFKKPEVCLFDLKTNVELAYLLKPLLESEKIVKVIHDVRNKSNALYNQFDIMLNNVFDTQVANLVIQQQETAKPAYKSRYISIQKLCEIYGDATLNKYRNLIRSKTRHQLHQGQQSTGSLSRSASALTKTSDANYWLARPLTDSMVYELTMDVYCLIGGVYQRLKATIKPEYEPLFAQLNQECVLARIKPEEIRSVKKERKIDLEVIDLKRKLYSQTMEKLVLSNREIRLLRHIDLTPEVRAKIEHCKKVAKKLERLDMKAAKLLEEENGSLGGETSSEQEQEKEENGEGGIAQSYLLGERQHELDALATMMDELKDKMIQDTSNFLDSFDEDEDEAELAAATASLSISSQHNHNYTHNAGSSNSLRNFSDYKHHHKHQHSPEHGDCCRCNCHRASSSSASSSSQASSLTHQQQQLSLTLKADPSPACGGPQIRVAINSESDNKTAVNDQTNDGGGEQVESAPESHSSSLVDSAIQCNLTDK